MAKDEKELLRLFRGLAEGDRNSLLDFAGFLASRKMDDVPETVVPSVPLDIPRPDNESVIKAVRRLMQTYPMLGRDKLLHETSSLVTRNVVHKDPAPAVIDELELLFRRHYDAYLNTQGQDDAD